MISINGWKKFCVGDLFKLSLSNDDIQPKSIINGDIPLVSSGKTNNGIIAYIKNDNATLQNSNTITVDMFGKAFYQKKSYFAVSHGRVNILTPKFNMSEYLGLYLASIIESVSSKKYTFNEMCTGAKLAKEVINLPVVSDGQPDWAYMESYMKQIMEDAERRLEKLKRINDTKHLINISGWGKFKIDNLFDISRPSSRSSQKYGKGNVPFVASGNFNNGIIDYLQPKNDKDYDKGNCITVSAVDGYAFYQKNKFLGRGGAGSSIIILRNNNLNEMNSKFICTLIRKACSNWEYSNMGNKDKLANVTIRLPITKAGEPNWQYMEEYMQKQSEKSESAITKLQSGL